MKKLSLKSITVMEYLDIDRECHSAMVDNTMSPGLEERLNYLDQLKYKLWANGEIVKYI